jgi:hypothetical protein
MRKLLFLLAAVAGAAALTYRYAFLPWFRTWGVVPGESARPLAGDEIIPNPNAGETRSILIDAPPASVWPWLVQMGFGRAGWYSYDPIDMSGTSSRRILPEHQSLAVGDLLPTHPGGGFVVRIIDPERALVVTADTASVQEQAEAYAQQLSAGEAEESPVNLKATEAIMAGTQPMEFAASWAFVLEPAPRGGTKLIERFRVRFGETDKPWTRFTLPAVGIGVFMMMRKQMLGIKERAEGASVIAGTPAPEPETEPVSS